MNKDGVPFGAMCGVLSVLNTMSGFTGNKHLLEADEYRFYTEDLGEKYQVMDLYFKPYPCCRWAHPAIDACIGLMKENKISPDNVKSVKIYTFKRATLLSKIIPNTADEAQYNIAYPVAAAIVKGDFGLNEVMDENLHDKDVIDMMGRLEFVVDPDLDARFPSERICRAEIITSDGKVYLSQECSPRGEANENIRLPWLCDKFRRLTSSMLSSENQEKLLSLITQGEDVSIRTIVDTANSLLGL